METGTQILIERMKTHPEEFIEGSSKWGRALSYARDCLPEEDTNALEAMYRQMKVNRFNEEVLKTLTGENEPDEGMLRYAATNRYAGGFTDMRGLFGSAPVKLEGSTVTVSGSAISGSS